VVEDYHLRLDVAHGKRFKLIPHLVNKKLVLIIRLVVLICDQVGRLPDMLAK
jgi:hypothetical protein